MQISASTPYQDSRFLTGPSQQIISGRRVIPQLFVCISVALALLMPVSVVSAQDDEDWWFDVEVIAFKRNTAASQVDEDFSSAAFEPASGKFIDLLSLPLYQKANPLLALQNMVYECSPDSALYTTSLPVIGLKAVPLDSTLVAGNSSPGLADSEDDSPVIFAPALVAQTLNPKLLTPQERVDILLDPLNCSDEKKAIAESLLVVNSVDKVSRYLDRPEIEVTNNAHFLADNQLNLIDYASKLFAQRNVKALAHLAWRQPVVFGEDKADFYRVFFGDKLKLPEDALPSYEDLKQKYDPEASNVIDQNSETFFDELKQQLADDQKVRWKDDALISSDQSELSSNIDDVWEMDGAIKVYLKYVNRVPYLHVESEFQFNEMTLNSFAEAQIEQYPFKQRRRVISKQIHYFDHPKMGLIIRLQRYEKPKEVEDEDIY